MVLKNFPSQKMTLLPDLCFQLFRRIAIIDAGVPRSGETSAGGVDDFLENFLKIFY
jgi:hypothetical protein